jgi:molybdopterin molybdotransferase
VNRFLITNYEADRMEDISFTMAFDATISAIRPLSSERASLDALVGRVAFSDIRALVDVPSADISLKDGYAIQSADLVHASRSNPVTLRTIGRLAAGSRMPFSIGPGSAIKIMSGAVIPEGADAVVSQEFTVEDGDLVRVCIHANHGRNILARGSDMARGDVIVGKGTRFSPAAAGLVAAAGYGHAEVYRSPRVAIIATGDEVVAVGTALEQGQVFASNLVTIAAWCGFYGMTAGTIVVRDREEEIANALGRSLAGSDCLITSGGAWKGDRDLVVKILDRLGWEKIYHRVKMGPGKAVGFGLFQGKPVFCLPGGPPSNQMAFLQLALPGLLALAGHSNNTLPIVDAVLSEDISGQPDWTQFIHGSLSRQDGQLTFHPLLMKSRLQFMAKADAIASIPEGVEKIEKGCRISVQMLGA